MYHRSTYLLTDWSICPQIALESHLKLFPGFPGSIFFKAECSASVYLSLLCRYGDLVVRTISETRFSDFTERRIRVHVETKGADSQSREIVQEHNSVNTNTNHLTHAIQRINVCNFMLEWCGIKKKTFVDILIILWFDWALCSTTIRSGPATAAR